MIRKFLAGFALMLLLLLLIPAANAKEIRAHVDGSEIAAHTSGSILPNAPDYAWYHGCSPTSAGMMMGYYDRIGYDNLVPGGPADLSTYGNAGAAVNSIIASTGHINDYYRTGYGTSGDDIGPTHTNDSLADFMGTSQDAYGNSNGATTFFFYTDGSRMSGANIEAYGSSYYNRSGMYGIYEYAAYAGYSIDLDSIYNQYTDNYSHPNYSEYGQFTFDDYMAEIDAGRVVMIHVEGHSMFGYGYDAGTSEIILHDTWNAGEKRMDWGGSYSGMELYGITAFEMAAVPVPGTMGLLSFGLISLVSLKRRSNQR